MGEVNYCVLTYTFRLLTRFFTVFVISMIVGWVSCDDGSQISTYHRSNDGVMPNFAFAWTREKIALYTAHTTIVNHRHRGEEYSYTIDNSQFTE